MYYIGILRCIYSFSAVSVFEIPLPGSRIAINNCAWIYSSENSMLQKVVSQKKLFCIILCKFDTVLICTENVFICKTLLMNEIMQVVFIRLYITCDTDIFTLHDSWKHVDILHIKYIICLDECIWLLCFKYFDCTLKKFWDISTHLYSQTRNFYI